MKNEFVTYKEFFEQMFALCSTNRRMRTCIWVNVTISIISVAISLVSVVLAISS